MKYSQLARKLRNLPGETLLVHSIHERRILRELPDDERIAYRIVEMIRREPEQITHIKPPVAGEPDTAYDQVFEMVKRVVREAGTEPAWRNSSSST